MPRVVPVPGTEPIYRTDADPAICIGGCGRPAIARGMCLMHYKRVLKHGVLETKHIREDAIREKRKRVARWERVKQRATGVTGWRDCAHFLSDVGEPPAGRVTLVPLDQSETIGPGNFQWIKIKSGEHFVARRKCGGEPRWTARYTKDQNLRKSYGISLVEYEQMLAAQGGVCAICKQPERYVKSGKLLSLAVDHDHNLGRGAHAVRGLLCANCNRMLGLAADDVSVLASAIDYLTQRQAAAALIKEAA